MGALTRRAGEITKASPARVCCPAFQFREAGTHSFAKVFICLIAAIHHHGQDRSDKMPRRAYECPTCRGWHLTSKAERPSSARTSSEPGERDRIPGPAGRTLGARTGRGI